MTAPAPIMLRLDRWAELRVVEADDTEEIVLCVSAPDCDGAPLFETRLTIEQTIDLIGRLVGTVAQIRKIGRPDPGAGPISSTL